MFHRFHQRFTRPAEPLFMGERFKTDWTVTAVGNADGRVIVETQIIVNPDRTGMPCGIDARDVPVIAQKLRLTRAAAIAAFGTIRSGETAPRACRVVDRPRNAVWE